jgi:hypothetical protein
LVGRLSRFTEASFMVRAGSRAPLIAGLTTFFFWLRGMCSGALGIAVARRCVTGAGKSIET